MVDIKNLTKSSKELKILYVEDDDTARKKTIQLLHNFFDDITLAIDGVEGLNKFANRQFDLVITDINMPNMSGIDMLRKIRIINKDIPCIILSAHDDIDYFIESTKLCLDGYILKPIEMTQFVDILFKVNEKIKLKEENLRYKINLENLVNQQIKELRQKDELMFQQSKLASMGEMMDAVAHQWKQPLNAISVLVSGLEAKIDFHQCVDEEDVRNCISGTKNQVCHLVETIDEFRGFFRTKSNMEVITIKDILDSVVFLVKKDLIKYKIDIEFEGDENIKARIIPNEFKHIIINLINNSKDQFVHNSIENRKILFNLFKSNDKVYLQVEDNAGGIREDIINDVFKSDFTTKQEGKGTGIGLYMSKNIINKIGGTIKVNNKNDGVVFEITI